MDAEPEGQNWAEVKYEEVVDNRPNVWYYGEANWFELGVGKKINEYHIYHDGKIEKHISSSSEVKKYKYIYVDNKGKQHDICTVNYHTTKEKSVGHKKSSKPTHSTVLSDNNVSEGNTKRRVKYSNGDVAEYGKHPKYGNIWRLYKAGTNNIELVKMPDSLNIVKSNFNIKYTFSSSQRRYTSPGHLAALIGALAENDFAIVSTGSCFKEGSAFPSYAHSNGKSIDTLYLNDSDEQKFINAMHKFNFNKHLIGPSKKKFNHATRDKVSNGKLHDSHLHSSFNESSVIIIK